MKGNTQVKKLLAVVPLLMGSLVLAPPASAEECAHYGFAGFVIINQDNGFRVEFPCQGWGVRRISSFSDQ